MEYKVEPTHEEWGGYGIYIYSGDMCVGVYCDTYKYAAEAQEKADELNGESK